MTELLKMLLVSWLHFCAVSQGVDPYFAYAVMVTESRPAHSQDFLEFRVGPIGHGKYYGPMGVAACYLKRWPIDNPFVNILVGVRALRGRNWRRVLRRYNASYNEKYRRAVWEAMRVAKKRKVFEGLVGWDED